MSLSLIHRHVPASRPALPPLLMLHGTGGDETDLLPLGDALLPGAAMLSPRGPVSEGGMPRFFARHGHGVFDPAEVRHRADELAAFVREAQTAYGLAAPVAVGFSNGANVAAVLLQRHPGLLAGAVLLRPMLVLDEPAAGPLEGTPVLMLAGRADPIVPPGSAERLAAILQAGGATVDLRVTGAGHGLGPQDVRAAQDWLARTGLAAPLATAP